MTRSFIIRSRSSLWERLTGGVSVDPLKKKLGKTPVLPRPETISSFTDFHTRRLNSYIAIFLKRQNTLSSLSFLMVRTRFRRCRPKLLKRGLLQWHLRAFA